MSKADPKEREHVLGEWESTPVNKPKIKYRAFLDEGALAVLARKASENKGKQAIDGPIRVVIL